MNNSITPYEQGIKMAEHSRALLATQPNTTYRVDADDTIWVSMQLMDETVEIPYETLSVVEALIVLVTGGEYTDLSTDDGQALIDGFLDNFKSHQNDF